MIKPEGEIIARGFIGGAVSGVELKERAGANFAERLQGDGLREEVSDVGPRYGSDQVRIRNIRHRFGPAHRGGLRCAINAECVVAIDGEPAVFDDGFDGAVIRAGDAGAEADNFLVEHEPGFLRAQCTVPGI